MRLDIRLVDRRFALRSSMDQAPSDQVTHKEHEDDG